MRAVSRPEPSALRRSGTHLVNACDVAPQSSRMSAAYSRYAQRALLSSALLLGHRTHQRPSRRMACSAYDCTQLR